MTLKPLFSQDKLNLARELVRKARRVTIVCHISPDGDALGSALAMMHMINATGRTARVVTPDTPPSSLTFLPGFDTIVSATTHTEMARGLISNCDLLICTDFSQASRVDKLSVVITGTNARKLVIDHHLDPSLKCDVMLSCPEQSSTCSLLFHIIWQLGKLDSISRESAECMLAGMMTDTGHFSYNSMDPDIYRIIAWMVEKGIDKEGLYKRLFNTVSQNRLRLNSYALDRKLKIYPLHRSAVISLTANELRKFGYVKGDTEGLVNVPLSIPEIVYSIFLREDKEGQYVRVSVRSKGDFPADIFCREFFGGGGHRNAAGGEVKAPMEKAIEEVEKAFVHFDKYLPADS